MKKSKEQKRFEAEFRVVRGELVDAFRDYKEFLFSTLSGQHLAHLTQDEVDIGLKHRCVNVITLKELYYDYPASLTSTGFTGMADISHGILHAFKRIKGG